MKEVMKPSQQNEQYLAIPISIGNSLIHWTSYLVDVNRQNIINEGSIKYGISELLEVSKAQTENKVRGIPSISSYKFEEEHPNYLNRDIDLMIDIKDVGSISKSTLYTEFKYVHSKIDNDGNGGPTINTEQLQEDEVNRYIDDIFRLLSLVKNNETNKSFFLVLGLKQDVDKVFTSNTFNRKRKMPKLPEGVKDKFNLVEENNVLKQIFPYKLHECRTSKLSDIKFEKAGITHIQRFNGAYLPDPSENDSKTQSLKKQQKSIKILDENDQVSLSLIFDKSSGRDDELYELAVKIWQVEYPSPSIPLR